MASAADLEKSMASPVSFQPPTLPGTNATARHPAWILLDKDGHIEHCRNATEAHAQTSLVQQVTVSFFTAEPPGLSHFNIHCPGLTSADFATQPRVLPSEDNLALLSLCLGLIGSIQTEYFIYRAGSKPSLDVHGLASYTAATKLSVATIGFVALGGEHFVLAALKYTLTAGQYEVHVFRSEPGTWTRNLLLQAELSAHGMWFTAEKAIALGGGKIGWVDLWEGILVCDVDDENPVLGFIPLPTLLPANLVEFKSGQSGGDTRPFRDVVITDGGVITCVEREICTRRIVRETPPDVSTTEVLHDSELWVDRTRCYAKEEYEYLGWRIITWSRMVSSGCCWRRGYLVHVDEILANSPTSHSSVMSTENGPPRNLTLRELITCFPTLSMVDGDVVYLVCKGELEDKKAWVVTINMTKKAAEELVSFSSEGSYFSGMNYSPCALSKYLNTN